MLCLPALQASEQTRDVQTELKTQGFYFGEVDGQTNGATSAAIKRYQIRNGLEVTGEVNPQTLQSLGIEGNGGTAAVPAPDPEPAQVAPPPVPRTQAPPPVNLRRNESVVESDRRALRQETEPRPAQPDADSPPTQPSSRYAEVFAGTPYASAPRVVQEETFLRAQRILTDRGLLASADGVPGPVTDEALLGYQRSLHLPPTGHLDLETLNSLRLLPGRGAGNPGMVSQGRRREPGPGPNGPGMDGPGPNRVARPQPYKGVWVQ